MSKKVFVKTFGCQMNVYDSEKIVDALKIIGYEKSEDLKKADCFILNTCHIRDKAKEKVYHEIGRVRELFLNKNKPLVIVAGCVAQAENNEMLKREPYIDMVIGPQSYHKLNESILKFQKNKSKNEKESFAFIGNHSHSHDYLLDLSFEKFKADIIKSVKIFEDNLGYNPIFFSYPFGEFSEKQLSFIKKKFKYGFGQHSGVIDVNKDPFELPRFPINEKYGDLERFEFIIDLLPLEYKNVIPKDKYITNNNPPKLEITFFEDQKNLENINCFSDEGNNWKQSKIKFKDNKLFVDFSDKFLFRRGRINCSLNDKEGWRWFGLQFSVRLN